MIFKLARFGRTAVFAVAALATLGSASGADDSNIYRDPDGRFSFQVPAHWQVRQVPGQNARLLLTGGEGASCLWTIVPLQGRQLAGGSRNFKRILATLGDDFVRRHLPYEVLRFERSRWRTRLDGEPAQIYEGAYRTEIGLEGRLDVFVAFREFGALILSCTHDFEQIIWPEAREQFLMVRRSTRFSGQAAYAMAPRYRILTGMQQVATHGH